MMKIVKVPSGETKNSFLKSRKVNIQRQLELYRFILDDIECYDRKSQTDIVQVELKLLDILKRMKEAE